MKYIFIGRRSFDTTPIKGKTETKNVHEKLPTTSFVSGLAEKFSKIRPLFNKPPDATEESGKGRISLHSGSS